MPKQKWKQDAMLTSNKNNESRAAFKNEDSFPVFQQQQLNINISFPFCSSDKKLIPTAQMHPISPRKNRSILNH